MNFIEPKDMPTLVIIGLAMLIFGISYAVFIAINPFKPGWTWLSVLIGDGATDIGSFFLIYTLTGNVWLALIPVFSHILTGGPMIAGQIIKHKMQEDGVIAIGDDGDR